MKLNSLHARSPRLHRRRASRAGMALAFAAAACAVAAPNVFAAGDDSAASSSSSSSSHSSTGTKIRDATVTTKAKAALIGTSGLSAGDVHVKTRRGNVTLTGSVPDEQQRTMAVNAVKQVDGVQDVRDQLTIRPK
ncbi:BON domain-containing protein [Burkholderia pseudomultivorans]|uniref:Osmotically-inducible protein Y n=1 Tax=Burkholderia pseudomultivorans TaxID=1207504 RepID=A0ABU2E2N9_9BURK|nr:BON domain-containing protein [Burkholderia pseudomultivorans]MDR8727467.1 Osmotically-inducible protein Y [Burkholderia pseudomultivorans]MDR8736663.1 Osmotically-inducible protein Y [Burkholderia pseudomultivorans]MDR8740413.1 Osmotically-inducible protein Y [Burkholderia pseudomultivorans]MDR8754138.1 Osmotically-inducible protein Y [Burkholderia pseudomultivorans]MDR8776827.1 Osmotically-inducible protein Y [Burkholderia pseudomultivorans]